MSIKPIDMKTVFPKAAEAAKVRSDEEQKAEILQKQVSDHQDKNIAHNMKQVVTKDKTEGARINEKDRKNRDKGQKKSKKQNRSNEDEDGKNKEDKINSHKIDIRL